MQVAGALLVAFSASILAVSAAGAAADTNLVINGTFANSNKGFTSQYAFTTNLTPPATYTIGLDPNKYNGNWPTIKPHDATGMMMIVNGSTAANKTVWSETLAVKPDSSYVFALWVASLYASPPVLKFSANGTTLGSESASTTVGAWKKIFFPWQSGSSKSVTLSLVDTNLAYGGNDFALSDVAFTGPAA